jgi:ABC-type transport system involved in cytochrome c biogenesis permease subunit
MGAQPNVSGMARFLYVVVGVAAAGWGIWGGSAGMTQWFWLALGGSSMVLGLIGYSPLHALFGEKSQGRG